jgi:preprotein translocase subunit SecD
VNKAIIDRVQKESGNDVLDPSGERLAWWVPVRAGSERSLFGSNVTPRMKTTDHREIMEVLVVADPYNVTGDYLTQAHVRFDALMRPMIQFALNDKGGELFNKLTGDHLSNEATGLQYRLGIIIDGELFSAPTVQSRIGKEGVITGQFTEVEASDIAAALRAGHLPVKLRLVGQRLSFAPIAFKAAKAA